ncbi:MAG: ABC transporter ATP-binding protein [Anaerolineae bacterium]|nr:ABC transporter ATP-binding protein [Anaerolineae bacterium]
MADRYRPSRDGPAIRAEGLSKTFATRQGRTPAVRDLSLEIAPGETFGLVGPDGAGKTTVLRLLVGLLAPTAGRAQVLGYDVAKDALRIRERIGYMAQQFGMFPELTVAENIAFFANLHNLSRATRAARISRLLEFAGLSAFTGRQSQRLSGGMQKKLALACMLVHEPEAVFMDEPSTGVDPVARREFWDILTRLRVEKGLTILVTTPYMDEAERCNRVGLMFEGRLVAVGAPRAITQQVPGEVIELRPSDFKRAKAMAGRLPGVIEVQTSGDLLHLFVDSAPARARGIVEGLRAQGVGVSGVRPIAPRLEHAFVSLIRKERAA